MNEDPIITTEPVSEFVRFLLTRTYFQVLIVPTNEQFKSKTHRVNTITIDFYFLKIVLLTKHIVLSMESTVKKGLFTTLKKGNCILLTVFRKRTLYTH